MDDYLHIELETEPDQTSLHRIVMADPIPLLVDHPDLSGKAQVVADRRVLTRAVLANAGLALSPVKRELAELAELVRQGAKYILTFRWNTPTGGSTDVMIHRLPFPPYDRVSVLGSLMRPWGSFIDSPTSITVVPFADGQRGEPKKVCSGYALISHVPQETPRRRR